MDLEFIPIRKDGSCDATGTDTPEFVPGIIASMKGLYETMGYRPPWIGYLVKENDKLVGTCGFKAPPHDGRAELAYFTFPEHESRGIATQMAAELVRLSLEADQSVTVAAQTLPEKNASTSILKKLNFVVVGDAEDDEVGRVWEWQLVRMNSGR